MARADYILPVLLGAAYVVAVRILVSVTLTWGDPVSSDDFWGQSNATAVAYMQIYHSIGVVLAALPISLAIVWRYKVDWLRPAGIAAVVATLYMLFDQIRGAWLISQHGVAPATYQVVSGAIDVVKVGLILLLLTALLRCIVLLRRKLQ